MRHKKTVAERIDARTKRGRKCWLWQGSKLPHGYGTIKVQVGDRRKTMYVHRLVWEQHNGPIPKGHYVLHKCDNPSCVRPDHLFLGTQQDNMAGMVNKGRNASVSLPMEQNPNAKLTADVVLEIRRRYATIPRPRQVDLASEFNISQTQVSRIVRGDQW